MKARIVFSVDIATLSSLQEENDMVSIGSYHNFEYAMKPERLKADFHSVQNVARSTFSARFLLNYKQSSGTNFISCG